MAELEQLLKEIMSRQYFAVLNSIGEGLPYSNLVSFVVSNDMKSLVFVTKRNTRKYKNIKQNAHVSLLIDNRTNSPSDISQAIAITVIGTASEGTDYESDIQVSFLTKHPQLKQFIKDTRNAIIMVKVKEYIIASFDKTQHLLMS